MMQTATSAYKTAADCPLGPFHGSASTHGDGNGNRLCDWCGFPVDDTPTTQERQDDD